MAPAFERSPWRTFDGVYHSQSSQLLEFQGWNRHERSSSPSPWFWKYRNQTRGLTWLHSTDDTEGCQVFKISALVAKVMTRNWPNWTLLPTTKLYFGPAKTFTLQTPFSVFSFPIASGGIGFWCHAFDVENTSLTFIVFEFVITFLANLFNVNFHVL